MATFQKRGDLWRAIVRKHGRYASESFKNKAQAQLWALEKELEFASAKRGDIPENKFFSDLIERYLEEKGVDIDKATDLRLRRVLKLPLSDTRLIDLSGQHVAEWRDARLKDVSAASVLREWNTLSSICTRAVKEWRWLKANPFKDATRPNAPASRTRRLEGDELDRILHVLGYQETVPCMTRSAMTGAAALFAVETGMRASEICSFRKRDINGRVVTLRKTKNGDTRTVPLTKRALAILSQLPMGVFTVHPPTLETLWRRARDKALVEDLHFHDLRREALTRMAKKVDVLTLAKISGHRDLKVLLNTYYAPRMDEVVLD